MTSMILEVDKMFEKLEKFLCFYVFILYLIFEVAVIGIFALGPLVFGLIFSPYWFLGYILTVVIIPLLILMVMATPEIVELMDL